MTASVYLECKHCGYSSVSDYVPPIVTKVIDGALTQVEISADDITVTDYFTKYYFWPRCECGSRNYTAKISEDTPYWFK